MRTNTLSVLPASGSTLLDGPLPADAHDVAAVRQKSPGMAAAFTPAPAPGTAPTPQSPEALPEPTPDMIPRPRGM
ncbi:hypothetical protein [Methylobacterium fujisawaense]|jgi:hypothetical protein